MNKGGIRFSNLLFIKIASTIKIALLLYFSFNLFNTKNLRDKSYYCGNSYWCLCEKKKMNKNIADRTKKSYTFLLELKEFILDKNEICLDNFLKSHSSEVKQSIRLKIKYYNEALKIKLEKNDFAGYIDIFNQYDLDILDYNSVYKLVIYCRKSLRYELKKSNLIYLVEDLKYISPKEKYLISESIFMI